MRPSFPLFLGLLAFIYYVEAARILVILPSAAIDFHKFYRPVVKRLSQSHELVVVSSQPMNFESSNMTVYEVPMLRKIWDKGVKNLESRYPFTYFYHYAQTNLQLVQYILANQELQSVFDADQHYDAVAVEFFDHSPLYAFARRFNCPLIGLAPNDEIDHEAVGNMWNYYQYPHPGFQLKGPLPNLHGVYAVWAGLAKRWFIDWPATTTRDQLIRSYFGSQISTTRELSENVDLVIMNAPAALDFARPVVPVVQQLGWFHIETPTPPLDADTQKFLNESRHGAIYVNFNYEIMSKPYVHNMESVLFILSAVKATSYDVICNWDGDVLPPMQGIKYIKNANHQSLLAHSKVVLYMAEASIRVMEEAVWYKKPLLTLQNVYQRNLNPRHLECSTLGIALYEWDKEIANIKWKITEVLSSRK